MSKKARARPNLFIVGAPKCGTTAWVEYLRTHPDIFFPEMKEPNFFAADFPAMRWISKEADYDQLFRRAANAKVIGEASAMYLYSTAAAEGIHRYNPDAKILAFLRDQRDFLPSLHHQLLLRFVEPIEDFERAWRLSQDRPDNSIPATCRDRKLLDYASFGLFGEQLQRYFDVFSPTQILIVKFDEWTSNPREAYLQILEFLGVPDDGRTDFPRVNEAKSFKNAFIGRLVAHPPRFAHAIANAIKRITGRSALGIAAKITDLLAEKGYRTTISDDLRNEIDNYYREDKANLDALITRLQGDSRAA